MARKKKATFRPGPETDATPFVPIDPKQKNLGALPAVRPDAAGVEAAANLTPDALREHLNKASLDPKTVDAIFKRHAEIQRTKPKAKTRVMRDAKTGRAMPAAPATPVVENTPDPSPVRGKKLVLDTGEVVRPAKNRELKRGIAVVSAAPKKKRAKKQAPIAQPKVGQAGSLDGQIVRVTPENLTQVYDQKRRTELPAAGEDVMRPSGAPVVEGVMLPSRLRASQNKKNLGGFGGSHKVVSSLAHEALGHLQTMANNEPGTTEHHGALESFNVIHSRLGQVSNSNFHKFMGMGRTIVHQQRGPNMGNALKVHRQGILGKLEEGRLAEQARGERSGPVQKEGQ